MYFGARHDFPALPAGAGNFIGNAGVSICAVACRRSKCLHVGYMRLAWSSGNSVSEAREFIFHCRKWFTWEGEKPQAVFHLFRKTDFSVFKLWDQSAIYILVYDNNQGAHFNLAFQVRERRQTSGSRRSPKIWPGRTKGPDSDGKLPFFEFYS